MPKYAAGTYRCQGCSTDGVLSCYLVGDSDLMISDVCWLGDSWPYFFISGFFRNSPSLKYLQEQWERDLMPIRRKPLFILGNLQWTDLQYCKTRLLCAVTVWLSDWPNTWVCLKWGYPSKIYRQLDGKMIVHHLILGSLFFSVKTHTLQILGDAAH